MAEVATEVESPADRTRGGEGKEPRQPPAAPAEPPTPEFESYPLTRPEYINAIIHFYRGELARSTAARARIDQTTNWAIVLMAGIFSFAFGSRDQHHVVLLFGDLMILLFLSFEARRYRRYDAWHARVRMIEENFYIPILKRDLISPMGQWRLRVAEDLRTPRYKITRLQAVGIRLVRNYLWLFLIELAGWIAKITMHPDKPESLRELYERMHVGFVPSWAVLGTIVSFYATIIVFAWKHRGLSADREMRSEMVPHSVSEWREL